MFITVILPLNLKMVLTYRVTPELEDAIKLGVRVTVPMGNSRVYSAIVIDISEENPTNIKCKDIISVVDSMPIIPSQQIVFWKWISEYYITSLGSVMNSFLPREFKIKGVMSDKTIVYDKTPEIEKNVIVSVDDTDKEKVREQLSRSKVQLKAYEDIVSFCESNDGRVLKKQLLQIGYSNAIIKQLLDKGIIKISVEQNINSSVEDINFDNADFLDVELDEFQQNVLELLQTNIANKQISLLNNQTSKPIYDILFAVASGFLKQSENVLVLCADNRESKQFALLAKKIFGDRVVEYDSTISPKNKFLVYNKVRNSCGNVIVGVGSAISLPFDSLSMILVIDEHSRGHKQESSPRILIRDCAVMLGLIYDCAVILESRTPSLESYYNTTIGKYSLVEYKDNKGMFSSKKISIINKFDIGRGERVGKFNNSENRFLSKYLLDTITRNKENNKTTLLYKNQLGYSRYMSCNNCDYVPQCDKCNIALYYDKTKERLTCQICGFAIPFVKKACLRCDSEDIEYIGYGTENIEASVVKHLDDVSVLRFDSEALSASKQFKLAVEKIKSSEVDVVVGSNILIQNHGFDNIGAGVIVDCDAVLNSSDFRAEERFFQTSIELLSRCDELIIQSTKTNYPVFKDIMSRSYKDFFERETHSRKAFLYPPFARFVLLRVRHRDQLSVDTTISSIYNRLSKHIAKENMLITKPFVDKVRERYVSNLIIKILPRDKAKEIKYYINETVEFFKESPYFRGYSFEIDVDKQ